MSAAFVDDNGPSREHDRQPIALRWLAPFTCVAVAAQISALVFPGTESVALWCLSSAILAGTVAATLAMGRLGCASWLRTLGPIGYVASLALLFSSQASISSGLMPLVLLPIVWGALLHRPRESSAVVAAAVGMLALVSWLDGAGADVVARRSAIWGLAGAIVVFGTHTLLRWLSDAIDEREEALRQAEVLRDAARALNETLDSERIVATGVRLAAEIASPPGSRPQRANYCRVADGNVTVSAERDGEGVWVGTTWPLHEHPLLARAVRQRTPTSGALDPSALGPRVARLAVEQGVAHGAWVPVVVDDELHGVLAVAGRNRPVSEQELATCEAIVGIMEPALRNARAHERSQTAALTDPLTGLANRRGLEQIVAERRGRGSLAVLAIDVDRLKETNDRHGHAAGDELLMIVSAALSSVQRAGDVVARTGGDEFACAIFDADWRSAVRVAERMLGAVGASSHRGRAPRISIGIACGSSAAALEECLRRADRAMYAAKRAGGMRVECAHDAVVTAA